MIMDRRYLIGSQLLGLNYHDKDELVIVDDENKNLHTRSYVDGVDILTCSVANLERQLNFEMPFTRKTAMMYINNYQCDIDIIKQDFPLKYHILDKRDKYIELLNWIVDNQACNFTKYKGINNGNCSKLIYHIAYLVFIIENNSVVLTAEQKAIVQKIHDRQMPNEYLDVLEEKIRSFK